MKVPKISELRKLLEYNRVTGGFTWKETTGTKAVKGSKAGYIGTHGYVVIYYRGLWLYAHRIAWAFETGSWPSVKIDHVDGNPSNNRFSNLRESSHSDNQANQKLRNDNTSGHKNVAWEKRKKKWRVRVAYERKEYHGGFFDNLEEAAKAARTLRKEVHGIFANHG